MLFNSTIFLLIFLPASLLAFYVVPPRFRLLVLTGSSLLFYAASGLMPLVFMLASIVWAWGTAFLLRGFAYRRIALVVALSFPFATLFLFRYLGFTLDTFGVPASERGTFSFFLEVLLPAGISFYTFHITSYTFDVYDRKIEPEPNLLYVLLYPAFFPQLIAGPIVRWLDVRDQYRRLATENTLSPDIVGGLKLLSFGLFVKVFLADVIHIINQPHPIETVSTTLDGLFLVFSYSYRIYFDFWAYSTIAVGLGKLFAVELTVNFREPYLTLNPRDFWRRWHVTLSNWLRDYVYLKIGGNQAYVRNIAIVFTACGLWHGAGWNFVVWGMYHAVLVIGYRFVAPWWDRLPHRIQVTLNFVLVSFSWPLFFHDIAAYGRLLTRMFSMEALLPVSYPPSSWLFLLAITVFTFTFRQEKYLLNTSANTRVFDRPVIQGALFCLGISFLKISETFIYFRF